MVSTLSSVNVIQDGLAVCVNYPKRSVVQVIALMKESVRSSMMNSFANAQKVLKAKSVRRKKPIFVMLTLVNMVESVPPTLALTLVNVSQVLWVPIAKRMLMIAKMSLARMVGRALILSMISNAFVMRNTLEKLAK